MDSAVKKNKKLIMKLAIIKLRNPFINNNQKIIKAHNNFIVHNLQKLNINSNLKNKIVNIHTIF